MKAMILEEPNTPFVCKQVPDPEAGPGEAVARVLACGSGLTIQHVKAGRIKAEFPRIIGHEISGEIIEVGRGVSELSIGDPVTAYYYINCGQCDWCLRNLEPLCKNSGGNVGKDCDGGYAEFIKLPAHLFIRLPNNFNSNVSPAEIGVITDAIATPLKVLQRARVKAGESLAIFGAGGGLGIHQLMLARWAQTKVIAIESRAEKFDACREAGADEILNASENDILNALLDLTDGQGVDVAIDYVSSTETLEIATQALGKRGRLVTLGGTGKIFRANALTMLQKEQELMGSRYVTRNEIFEAIDLVNKGEIRPLVSDIRPLEEAEALHEDLEKGNVIGRAALII